MLAACNIFILPLAERQMPYTEVLLSFVFSVERYKSEWV